MPTVRRTTHKPRNDARAKIPRRQIPGNFSRNAGDDREITKRSAATGTNQNSGWKKKADFMSPCITALKARVNPHPGQGSPVTILNKHGQLIAAWN